MKMNTTHPFFAVLLVTSIIVGLALKLMLSPYSKSNTLKIYCAAALRPPLENIAREFESRFDQHIEFNFGGSQTLLSNLETTGDGDLFIPADDSYLQLAEQRKLIQQIFPIAKMHAVILNSKDHPPIKNFAELFDVKLKLAQANPDAAAIGNLTRNALSKINRWGELKLHTEKYGSFHATVSEVANAVELGAADAGIVWDTVAFHYPKLKISKLPELDKIQGNVSIAILQSTRSAKLALKFAFFCKARDRGREEFRQNGFQITDDEVLPSQLDR